MNNRNRPKYKKIIEAAVVVIAENGFHQAQVSKIAKQAGVADGTIYLYFKNKEDLLVSLFQEKMGQFIDKTKKAINQKTHVEEKLETLVDMHLKLLADDHHMAIVTQLELRQSSKHLRAKINEVLKGYLAVIDEIIDKGKKEGAFSQQLDLRLARQMIFGTLDEAVSNWVMNDHKFDLVALSHPISHLLLNGLRG